VVPSGRERHDSDVGWRCFAATNICVFGTAYIKFQIRRWFAANPVVSCPSAFPQGRRTILIEKLRP
jgi:hypothetical protein